GTRVRDARRSATSPGTEHIAAASRRRSGPAVGIECAGRATPRVHAPPRTGRRERRPVDYSAHRRGTLMTDALVSVVVASFNGERFLREALDSLFAQDYEPFEVIFIDDGSEDGTAQIARTYD